MSAIAGEALELLLCVLRIIRVKCCSACTTLGWSKFKADATLKDGSVEPPGCWLDARPYRWGRE